MPFGFLFFFVWLLTSGNSDLVDTWADSVISMHSVLIQWLPVQHYVASLHLVPINAHGMWWPCCFFNWASNGSESQTQIITALTTSPPRWVWHISVNVHWQSWQCSQNLCGPFLRAVLPTNVKAGYSTNGSQREDKSSTTKMSFSTITITITMLRDNHD